MGQSLVDLGMLRNVLRLLMESNILYGVFLLFRDGEGGVFILLVFRASREKGGVGD